MTRKEYIEALDQYLVTMSASEKADILSDYEEHFRVGLENGKTESQIAASLGTPYDVANQFLDGQKPAVPTYPTHTAATAATASSQTYATAPRPASAAGTSQAYATAPRPASAAGTSQAYATAPRPASAAGTSQAYATAPRPASAAGTSQTYAAAPRPASAAGTSQTYAAAPRPTATASQNNPYEQNLQTYSRPAQPAQPSYQSTGGYGGSSGYVDYDRQAEERSYESAQPKAESKYNSTGIIVVIALCVALIPTVGATIVGLLVGLYGAIIAFATTGGSLIAVGTALSASSVWICVGMVFIGISFLALTGLLIMAAIEGTKLFVKLIRYCVKECKKMITEGSF